MLALYHLARFARDGGDPRALAGMSDLLDKAGVASLPKPKIAVFVGSGAGPDVSLKLDKGPRVHTVWGYLAWRLGGRGGPEARRRSRGRAHQPRLGAAGRTVQARRAERDPARRADHVRPPARRHALRGVPVVHPVADRGREDGPRHPDRRLAAGKRRRGRRRRGAEALRRMEKVFGRVQSPWLPASGDETYEIIRRRLFQPLDADGEKARDETVKAFADLYRKNAAEFPPEAKEKRYEELLRLSYPIHPELFDRLSKDWATLEKFQRTRGVLRFLANVVGVLWHSETRDPLITPARVPVAHERVRASVLYPLDPAFGAVVDREVDGDGSLPSTDGDQPVAPHLAGAGGDPGGARGVPVHGAAGRPGQSRRHGSGAAACLRRARRPVGDFRRGAARADRARGLPLRGSGPLLVLDPADPEPPRR